MPLAEANQLFILVIRLGCYYPKLIIYLSRPSNLMPLAEANQLFISVIHYLGHPLRMPLDEANQSFVLVIHSDAISRS